MPARLLASISVVLAAVTAACSGNMAGPTPGGSSNESVPSAVTQMAGSWTSQGLSSGATGPCSSVHYSVTPAGSDTASINYAATCAGLSISGTGTAVGTSTNLTWTSDGTALLNGGVSCGFHLTGVATPMSASTASITYSGTVCGVPVSGTDTLSR
jgi:hypothetical protein